jgi:hypothetical protein
MPDYMTMTGPQLVTEYNRLAEERNLPKVKRFASLAAGRDRCAAIATNTNRAADVFAEFNTSSRKHRGKLLMIMAENKGKPVSMANLIRGVYGSVNMDRRGALMMVMRGLQNTISKERLPYVIAKHKSENGVVSYGLYDQT